MAGVGCEGAGAGAVGLLFFSCTDAILNSRFIYSSAQTADLGEFGGESSVRSILVTTAAARLTGAEKATELAEEPGKAAVG